MVRTRCIPYWYGVVGAALLTEHKESECEGEPAPERKLRGAAATID
jgi:hypothetical protein